MVCRASSASQIASETRTNDAYAWTGAVTVILGCFVLFGASSIVAGIHSTATLGQ